MYTTTTTFISNMLYLSLCSHYHWHFVRDLPGLGPTNSTMMTWSNDVYKKLILNFAKANLPGFLAAVTWFSYNPAFNLSTFDPSFSFINTQAPAQPPP